MSRHYSMIALLSFHQIPCRSGECRARTELFFPILPFVLSTGDSNGQGVHPLWRRRGEEGCHPATGPGCDAGQPATKTGNRRGIEGGQQNEFTMRTAVTLSQALATVYECLRVFASDYECQRTTTSVNEQLRVSTSDYECQQATTSVNERLRVSTSDYECQQAATSVNKRLRVSTSGCECQQATTSVNKRLRVSTSDYECQRAAASVYEWLRVFASVYKSFLELNFNRWTGGDRAAVSVRGAGHLCAAVEKAGLVWLASERWQVCSRHSVKPGVVDV